MVLLSPPAPSREDLADAVVVALEQPEDREFRVTFNRPSDINGSIRCVLNNP